MQVLCTHAGFMCLDTDLAAGNMGMLDMVTALEWVQVTSLADFLLPNFLTILLP
jgi:hypothetical protein